jgi:ribonucleoside-triphosphate reductase
VVSINLPQIGLATHGDMEAFWPEFDRRLQLCYEALMCRHDALKGVKSDVSPIHWQYGAIARLKKGETIDKLLYGGYSSISLGYIGLYELTYLMTGESHTQPKGLRFARQVMQHLRDTTDRWKKETNIGFALYGTPAESLCYRFAEIDKRKYGIVPNVTDKGYYTNSYHVDVREPIDAFAKLTFETQFQPLSSGGCISYVEIPNMSNNLTALRDLVSFIYNNIQYAEFNTKSDYCQCCGYDGEIVIVDGEDGNPEWECPCCGNRDRHKMNVVRRTCGYLGENFWNVGKTKEIRSRVLHLT